MPWPARLNSLVRGAQEHHPTNIWIPFGMNNKLYKSVPDVVYHVATVELDTDHQKTEFISALGDPMDHGYKSHLRQLFELNLFRGNNCISVRPQEGDANAQPPDKDNILTVQFEIDYFSCPSLDQDEPSHSKRRQLESNDDVCDSSFDAILSSLATSLCWSVETMDNNAAIRHVLQDEDIVDAS